MKAKDITAEMLSLAVHDSQSITEVLVKLGMRVNNGSYNTIRVVSERFRVPLPVWNNPGGNTGTPRMSDDEFFVNGVQRNGTGLRKRLVKRGMPFVCFRSGCLLSKPEATWNDRPIVLHVDHIDGNKFNNSLLNLRFLCPNCHSQTETYGRTTLGQKYEYCVCGKRVKEKTETCSHFVNRCRSCGCEVGGKSQLCIPCESERRIQTGEGLHADWEDVSSVVAKVKEKGYLAVGREFGVSDNAVRAYLRRRGVRPLPKRERKAS